jgi:hypothetical protein
MTSFSSSSMKEKEGRHRKNKMLNSAYSNVGCDSLVTHS